MTQLNHRSWTGFRAGAAVAAAVAAAALLVLLPRLGSYGFWEPQEIRVAEDARQLAAASPGPARQAPGAPAAAPVPFTTDVVARSIAALGTSELGARLPLALLALLTVLATLRTGWAATGRARGGLLAALVLLSFPLFVLQARQLTSDVGAMAGASLLVAGLSGLVAAAGRRREAAAAPGWRMLALCGDVALVGLGTWLSHRAAGSLLGLAVPFGAVALATGLATRREPAGDAGEPAGQQTASPSRLFLIALAVATGAMAVAALWHVLDAVFDWRLARPGERATWFGWVLDARPGHVEALGGVWRAQDNLDANFNALFEQLAFGLFPWIAAAPLACVWLVAGRRRDGAPVIGHAIFAWAALAWIAGTVWVREIGPLRYPAPPAIALAIGIWLDHLLATRAADERQPQGHALSLAALFTLLLGLVVARDIKSFPEELTSLHVGLGTIRYPEGMRLHLALAGTGFLSCLALSLWLADWRGGRLGRRLPLLAAAGRNGLRAALGLGLAVGLLVAHAWVPRLAEHLSSKHLFDSYRDRRRGDEPLGVLGHLGLGTTFYAGASHQQLGSRDELFAFLRRPQRVFALAPLGERCALHQSANKAGLPYHVLDASHERFMMVSNRLAPGEVDRNPLAGVIRRSPPPNIGRRVHANFADTIELLGVDMPAEVKRGSEVTVTLHFKVRRTPERSWKIFIHADGAAIRFQGDHDPIGKLCPTTSWQEGDYITDTYTFEAGGLTFPSTEYAVWTGFFYGSDGSWTNMKVLSGDRDATDRLRIGTIRLK